MKQLLISTMLLVSINVFSQNVIILKSGEKINGLVIGLKDSSVTVNFKGNTLTLKKSEISSILFDAVSPSQDNSTGILRGVVTYYFNQYQGDKPDVGAVVYILDVTKLPDSASSGKPIMIDTAILKAFGWVSTCRELIAFYGQQSKDVPSHCLGKLEKYNAVTKEGWTEFDKKVSYQLILLSLIHSKVIKTTVDASGNYSKKLAVGKYFVVIQSKGRTSLSKTEISGKIDIQEIEIKSGQESIFDNRFNN